MEGKSISESRTLMTDFVLPNDANVHGSVLGGKVMHLIDLAGATAAQRHCRKPIVTVSVDSVRFLHPVKVGQLMLLEAVVNRAFQTSMEVEVQVFSEDLLTGERKKTCSAFLTFVAIDAQGRPDRVSPAIPETDEEKDSYEKALIRRRTRLQRAGRD